MDFYLLDHEKKPYKVSLDESYKLYENPDMKITKQDLINDHIRVSTVFLGMDHRFYWIETDNEPVLWETMIFGGEHDGYQQRYTSHEDALAGHAAAIAMVKKDSKNKFFKFLDVINHYILKCREHAAWGKF